MKCQLVRFVRNEETNDFERQQFSCNEVREKKEEWLKEFRDKNKSDFVKHDRTYECYKDSLESFLWKCECNKNGT